MPSRKRESMKSGVSGKSRDKRVAGMDNPTTLNKLNPVLLALLELLGRHYKVLRSKSVHFDADGKLTDICGYAGDKR